MPSSAACAASRADWAAVVFSPMVLIADSAAATASARAALVVRA
jgi:hypothetical protein